MRAEEFITLLSERSKDEESLKSLRAGVPLGQNALGEIVFSQMREHPYTVKHTCITGARRTTFIRRLLITLSCLYESSEANFFILSPRGDYGELLKLQAADITAPYIRTKEDLSSALACLKELVGMFSQGKGYPRLILVLDGLEELEGCNKNGDLEEYRALFEMLAREKNVEIVSGVELMRSIFSGDPGVFVGQGNCLVTTREEGKADVTYVGDDVTLSLPTAMDFPDSPSVTETIVFLNSLQKNAASFKEADS